MKRRLITTFLAGAALVSVYLAARTDFPSGPAGMRAATCGVRISDECLAQYPALRRYETLRFPVMREVVDGGLAFTLPGVLGDPNGVVRDCVDVVDWPSCELATCATYPAVCALWDAGQPVVRVRSASKYVIPDCRVGGKWEDQLGQDGGPVPDCMGVGLYGLPDGGGPRWFGCNRLSRDSAAGTQCLDAPSGIVYAGERLEDSL